MNAKMITYIVICVAILLCLTACYSEWMPQDGIWYCEALQMQISFAEGECFTVIDGEKILCDCINDKGSTNFFIISQASHIEGLPVGTELFSAERVKLTETEFVVREEKTGKEYVFIKISVTGDSLHEPG